MTSSTRSQMGVYLLGSTVTVLNRSELPSIHMALGLFLHNHLEKGETIRQSLTSTIKEIATFWYKARIPTRDVQNCQTKQEKLFEGWCLLKKNKGRQSVKQQSREAEFLCKLDNLFDIAHVNTMNIMKIKEDKHSDEEDTDNSDDDTVSCKAGPTQENRQRGRKVVITPQLTATLDRTKISDRKAMFVISETVKSLGHNITDLALNRNVPLVVYWNGKLTAGLTSKEQVDRLPVIVSGKGVSQLLTVAKLTSDTGEAQASAVYPAIGDWCITENIRAICFDTTSSNTGRLAGACVLLKQKIGNEL
ncbi:hypothetical protein QYM36_007819 [Artemia franciscana]|uniref:Uncharacterized protein n=1 Tax=Artemia franciscana TaxID=6661 RepID=A0AA88IEB5_ARTSF|nr:hypothetical protein QYM36_007819 [Artemia franciscana]